MGVQLVLAIALMNLVTAIMVEGSLAQADEDKEAKKAYASAKRKKQMERLRAARLPRPWDLRPPSTKNP